MKEQNTMNPSQLIRIVLVDDHDLVRSGLAVFLQAFDDLELVGEASNGSDAIRLCSELKPDIVLMDLMMPEMDGFAAIQNVKEQHPTIRIIVLTSFGDENLVQKALRAGANGFLYKDVSVHELADAIRTTYKGNAVLAPKAAKHLIEGMEAPVIPIEPLTPREYQVLSLMAEGMTNPEIANQLVVGQSTIKTHVSHILSKLGAANRQEAITLALRHKLIT